MPDGFLVWKATQQAKRQSKLNNPVYRSLWLCPPLPDPVVHVQESGAIGDAHNYPPLWTAPC